MSERQPSYDVEITIRSGRPFFVKDVSGKRAQEIIQSMYAAWGLAEPRSLADRPDSTFADRLAVTGIYQHAEADAVTSVKPHAAP